MRKTILLAGGVLVLVVIAGLSQTDQPDLSTLLLSQEQVQTALEDDSWVLSASSTLPQNPEGAQSATANYESPRHIANTILLDFSDLDLAGGFITTAIEVRRPKLKADPKDLLETLNLDRDNKADLALLFEFENGDRQLLFRRDTVVVLWQSDLKEADLLKLAQAHVDHLVAQGR